MSIGPPCCELAGIRWLKGKNGESIKKLELASGTKLSVIERDTCSSVSEEPYWRIALQIRGPQACLGRAIDLVHERIASFGDGHFTSYFPLRDVPCREVIIYRRRDASVSSTPTSERVSSLSGRLSLSPAKQAIDTARSTCSSPPALHMKPPAISSAVAIPSPKRASFTTLSTSPMLQNSPPRTLMVRRRGGFNFGSVIAAKEAEGTEKTSQTEGSGAYETEVTECKLVRENHCDRVQPCSPGEVSLASQRTPSPEAHTSVPIPLKHAEAPSAASFKRRLVHTCILEDNCKELDQEAQDAEFKAVKLWNHAIEKQGEADMLSFNAIITNHDAACIAEKHAHERKANSLAAIGAQFNEAIALNLAQQEEAQRVLALTTDVARSACLEFQQFSIADHIVNSRSAGRQPALLPGHRAGAVASTLDVSHSPSEEAATAGPEMAAHVDGCSNDANEAWEALDETSEQNNGEANSDEGACRERLAVHIKSHAEPAATGKRDKLNTSNPKAEALNDVAATVQAMALETDLLGVAKHAQHGHVFTPSDQAVIDSAQAQEMIETEAPAATQAEHGIIEVLEEAVILKDEPAALVAVAAQQFNLQMSAATPPAEVGALKVNGEAGAANAVERPQVREKPTSVQAVITNAEEKAAPTVNEAPGSIEVDAHSKESNGTPTAATSRLSPQAAPFAPVCAPSQVPSSRCPLHTSLGRGESHHSPVSVPPCMPSSLRGDSYRNTKLKRRATINSAQAAGKRVAGDSQRLHADAPSQNQDACQATGKTDMKHRLGVSLKSTSGAITHLRMQAPDGCSPPSPRRVPQRWMQFGSRLLSEDWMLMHQPWIGIKRFDKVEEESKLPVRRMFQLPINKCAACEELELRPSLPTPRLDSTHQLSLRRFDSLPQTWKP